MNLEKILNTICITFFTIFILSAILVLTNTLNMWLVGIVSLLISIVCLVMLMRQDCNKEKGRCSGNK